MYNQTMGLEGLTPLEIMEAAEKEERKRKEGIQPKASGGMGNRSIAAMMGGKPGETVDEVLARELKERRVESEKLAIEGLDKESGTASEEKSTSQTTPPATEQEPKKE